MGYEKACSETEDLSRTKSIARYEIQITILTKPLAQLYRQQLTSAGNGLVSAANLSRGPSECTCPVNCCVQEAAVFPR